VWPWQHKNTFIQAFLSVPGCQTCLCKRGLIRFLAAALSKFTLCALLRHLTVMGFALAKNIRLISFVVYWGLQKLFNRSGKRIEESVGFTTRHFWKVAATPRFVGFMLRRPVPRIKDLLTHVFSLKNLIFARNWRYVTRVFVKIGRGQGFRSLLILPWLKPQQLAQKC